MKATSLYKLAAAGCLAVALSAGAVPHPKLSTSLPMPMVPSAADCGQGELQTELQTTAQRLAASGAAETPMDVGLGGHPTLHSGLHASKCSVPLARATR